MVLRVCRAMLGDRHEVEDAFQATFLVLAVGRGRSAVEIRSRPGCMGSPCASRPRSASGRCGDAGTSGSGPHDGIDDRRSGERSNAGQRTDPHHPREIGRLPEKYRAVVVLCYLEGMTHEMAAGQLGWPVGSVRSRLAWARSPSPRLTRRGVAPAALPFVRSASAADPEVTPSPGLVPTTLADAAIRGP